MFKARIPLHCFLQCPSILWKSKHRSAYTISAINTLPTFNYFENRVLRKTEVVYLADNCQQLCLPHIRALHPSQLLYPYSFITSMDLLPHSVSFEPNFFKLPLKALTSCAVNAQSPSTLLMSPMTSVDLYADLIKMNGQQPQGQGPSSTHLCCSQDQQYRSTLREADENCPQWD